MSADPRIGAKIKLPPTDSLGRSLNVKTSSILVYLAGCDSCTAKRLDVSRIRGSADCVVLIYDEMTDASMKFIESLPGRFRVLVDEKRAVSSQLNTVWAPRYYLLDAAGCLTGLQSAPATVPSFVTDTGVRP